MLLLCAFAAHAEPVDINNADAVAIAAALKGIGPRKAEAIVEYRKQHGPFRNLDELSDIKGIGRKMLAALAADIRFGDPAAAGKKP